MEFIAYGILQATDIMHFKELDSKLKVKFMRSQTVISLELLPPDLMYISIVCMNKIDFL